MGLFDVGCHVIGMIGRDGHIDCHKDCNTCSSTALSASNSPVAIIQYTKSIPNIWQEAVFAA